LIEEPDRNKAKDERVGGAPKPKILVQEIKHYDSNNKQGSFHVVLKSFLQVVRDLTYGKPSTIVQETIWEDNISLNK